MPETVLHFEKRLPDARGWWARKRGVEVTWHFVEDVEGKGFEIYVNLFEDLEPVAKFTTPLTRWAGPVTLMERGQVVD